MKVLALFFLLAVPSFSAAVTSHCGKTFSCPHSPTLDGKSETETKIILMTALRNAVDSYRAYQELSTKELGFPNPTNAGWNFTSRPSLYRQIGEMSPSLRKEASAVVGPGPVAFWVGFTRGYWMTSKDLKA